MRLVVLASFIASAASGPTFTNPLTQDNTPDPGVWFDGHGTFHVATTGGSDGGGAFPLHHSSDLINWGRNGAVFPNRSTFPAWSDGDTGFFWAPEIHQLPNGSFAVIFAARRSGVDHSEHSIGIATADSVEGPWKDLGRPLITHPPPIGVIDPTLYFDGTDGSGKEEAAYVVYKVDANAVGKVTTLLAAQLDVTRWELTSQPWELLRTSEAWEGPLIEAPWVVKRNGTYYLFYSANYNAHYAVGVARSQSMLATSWEKLGQPIAAAGPDSGWGLVGPGHCSVRQVADVAAGQRESWVMWLHTWTGHQPSYNFSEPRRLTQMELLWNDATGWPYVANGGKPPLGPQPVPPFAN